MNGTACSSELALSPSPLTMHVRLAYLGLLLALGLLLNGLALWAFCCRLRRWTETHVYMVNLASADLCLLCALPFMLYAMMTSCRDTPLCQVSQGVYLANRYMSIGLITAIAADRYVAVRHPLLARRLRSPRRAWLVCLALWALVGSSLALRWVLEHRDGGFCFTSPLRRNPRGTAFSLLGFYPPLAVLGFCSVQVVTALHRSPAAAADADWLQTTRRAARMVWVNLAVFVVCFLPLHVALTWRLATGLQSRAMHYALYVTSRVSDANCCLDAVCYYYMAKEFLEPPAPARPPAAEAHKSQDSVCMTVA